MTKRNQKGPQPHAEGQHGSKTHGAFLEGRHGRHGGSEESEGAPQEQRGSSSRDANVYGIPHGGKHRLSEDRQQHDEADKNSEANRLAKQLGRDGKPIDGPSLKGGKRPGGG